MRRARLVADAPARAAPALAGAIALVYLIWAPPSADLATALYRADQFSDHGFVVYDPQWYAGFQPLGYSLLLGPLGALLGVRLLGALAAVVAAAVFARLVEAPTAALWFAGGVAVSLGSGRIAFTLGTALGLGALLAARPAAAPGGAGSAGAAGGAGSAVAAGDGGSTGAAAGGGSAGAAGGGPTAAARPGRLTAARAFRPAVAAGLAVASALASPLTGAFLGLAALTGAPVLSRSTRRARAGLALAALLPAGALALAFPTAGHEPFAASSFWPALALLVILAALAPALRPGVALYALACVAAYAVPTPVGGNVVRLGALFAGPVAAAVLAPRRRALALLALPLAYWQLQAPIRDIVTVHGDPSTQAAYYAPLERFLATTPGGPRRIEVPFTRAHWEAALLAPGVALARGWERQLDISGNAVFYRPHLSSAAYAAWLRDTAVAFVARPDVALDYSARQEARLIDAGPPYLRPVARLAHWRVYAVAGARPLAAAPAVLIAAGPDRFVLRFARPGTSLVRLRFTRYWVASGGCVGPAPGGFTAVTARRAGPLVVVAHLGLHGLAGGGQRCAG